MKHSTLAPFLFLFEQSEKWLIIFHVKGETHG